ncbi:hypothetical protein YC2023_041283 [Brassica napus]
MFDCGCRLICCFVCRSIALLLVDGQCNSESPPTPLYRDGNWVVPTRLVPPRRGTRSMRVFAVQARAGCGS